MHDIYKILSNSPLLESCILEIYLDSHSSTEPLDDTPQNPLRLPHIRTLKIGVFPQSHIDWLYDYIFPEILTESAISIPSPIGEVTPFSIPSRLHEYCGRAKSLKISGPDLVYYLQDHFEHSIAMNYGQWASPDVYPDFVSVIPLFTTVRQLFIGQYWPLHHTALLLALGSLDQLIDLRVHGCQTKLVNILPDLCQGDPPICPKLESLTLRDDQDWAWQMTVNDPAYISAMQDAPDNLEGCLKVRAEHNMILQKLVLSAGDWWSGELDKWKQLVGTVYVTEYGEDTW
ncbi:hypothetical protein SISSUDRAFT_1064808 [Sistotremastrum suecicum HHB10207 ss-3]|uniref:F-box domain-containing protein n=1 Tax=Sistotremastrum suecicum HHB10207 ss-3 TaxID=1314776 RepID=A0A166A728_9AGAM|nr:hypothetical protein SISSUDRAFT_1064808 [Sistotremastrum suecicum HHB10207 ss-3]